MNANVKAPRITRLAITALVSSGLALGAAGLAPVTAQRDPNTDWGPANHWCPGEPLPPTGNHVTDPIHDWNPNGMPHLLLPVARNGQCLPHDLGRRQPTSQAATPGWPLLRPGNILRKLPDR